MSEDFERHNTDNTDWGIERDEMRDAAMSAPTAQERGDGMPAEPTTNDAPDRVSGSNVLGEEAAVQFETYHSESEQATPAEQAVSVEETVSAEQPASTEETSDSSSSQWPEVSQLAGWVGDAQPMEEQPAGESVTWVSTDFSAPFSVPQAELQGTDAMDAGAAMDTAGQGASGDMPQAASARVALLADEPEERESHKRKNKHNKRKHKKSAAAQPAASSSGAAGVNDSLGSADGLSNVNKHGAGSAGLQRLASGAKSDADNEGAGLAASAPRLAAVAWCVVLALLFFAGAAGVYWLGVQTSIGQSYDDMVWTGLRDSVPGWFRSICSFLSIRVVIPAISITMAVIAFIVIAVRKRWWLLGQSLIFGGLCYAAAWLKRLLPRPFLIHQMSSASNTAPSGHTMLAVGASLVLLFAVPLAWRAVVAAIGGTYTVMVALSLVVERWHRPTDVVMSVLIGTGIALLTLAFTRASGMDAPKARKSSASVQIVASVLITFGVLFCLYGVYVLWNIAPGLDLSAEWAQSGAYSATVVCVIGLASLAFGLVLAMRHVTASPLTRLGLIGAPPTPPHSAAPHETGLPELGDGPEVTVASPAAAGLR